MTIIAPIKDRMIPVNLYLVNFSLKIRTENRDIKEGFRAKMIAARLAVIKRNPENKKILNPTVPVMPMNRMSRNPRKLMGGNLPNFLKRIKTKKKEARKNRKKEEVNGDRFEDNILPATGALAKNIVAKNNLM